MTDSRAPVVQDPRAGHSAPPTVIVGTAGHIDHGKTSLVKLLTGVDLDTLPEERERQITIALGFTSLTLPSGGRLAFIDVPGHERLVRTMVAGASGIDAAMLVVSAVEGVKPQTVEHLQILELLGVTRGLVALTFMDLVDEELLELAREEMRELLERTPLAGAPVIPVSNVTGQGRDEILQALEAFSPRARDQEAPFRLPVDRVFTRHGHGTVVSGTVLSGAVQEGETAGLAPGGLSARVRGIQVHGQKVPRAFAGQRAALNLSLSRTEVERGLQVISPGQVPETRLLDVRYRHLPDAPPLRDLELVRFLIGTADVLARIRTLGVDRIPPQEEEPGRAWEGYVQLRLQEPVAALPGDRFVLRRPSPTRTLGGGSVLDPWAHPIHKREAKKTLAQLRALAAGDRSVLLLRAGRAGLSLVEARIRGVEGVIVADRVLHPGIVASVEEEIRTAVAIFHEANPLLPGCGRAELRGASLRKLGDRVIEGLLARMAERGVLARAGNLFRLTDFKVRLSSEMEAARARVLHAARDASRTALETESLLQQAVSPRARELLALMTARGELVAVGPFLMDRATANALVEEARGWLAREGSFTTAQAKDWTGLTRKHLIPILEWLDATQVTRRVGEQRKAFR